MVARKVRLVTDAIAKVGFPIVMCLILIGVLVYVVIFEIPKISRANTEQMEKMTTTISQNTEAMQSLKRFLTKRYD